MIDLKNFQSINLLCQCSSIQSNFDQDQYQDTIFGNSLLSSYVLHVDDAHEIQFCSTTFFQIFFFSGSGFQ